VICVGVVQLLGGADTMAERLHLVRVVVTLQLLLGVTAIWILANALRRSLMQATSADAFLLALACSPWLIYALTNGVESGMTLLMFAMLLFGFVAWDPLGSPARRTDGVLGLLLAGLIFSRLDLAFLIPAVECLPIARLHAAEADALALPDVHVDDPSKPRVALGFEALAGCQLRSDRSGR